MEVVTHIMHMMYGRKEASCKWRDAQRAMRNFSPL